MALLSGATGIRAGKMDSIARITVPAPTNIPVNPPGTWPPQMADLGMEGKFSLVPGNNATSGEINDTLDAIEAGTNRLWGARLGMDWTTVEPSAGTYVQAAKSKYDIFTGRGYGVHSTVAYTPGHRQRTYSFKATLTAGTKSTLNADGSITLGTAKINVTDWANSGNASIPGGNWAGHNGMSISGPGLVAPYTRFIKVSGSTIYPSDAIANNAGVGTYTSGGHNIEADQKLETDEASAYGDMIDWLLSPSGLPLIKTINFFNEGQHRIGAMPYVDIALQFQRQIYGYFAAKNRNPNVYAGFGSAAYTANSSNFPGAQEWMLAFVQYCNTPTAKAAWQALRNTLSPTTKAKTSDTYPFDFILLHPYFFARFKTGSPPAYTANTENIYTWDDNVAGNHYADGKKVYEALVAYDSKLTGIRILNDEVGAWHQPSANTGTGISGNPSVYSETEGFMWHNIALGYSLHRNRWIPGATGWANGFNPYLQEFYFCIRAPSGGAAADANHGIYNTSDVLKQASGTTRDAPYNANPYANTRAVSGATSHSGTNTIDFSATLPTEVRPGMKVTGVNIPANSYIGTIAADKKSFTVSSVYYKDVSVNVPTGTTGSVTITIVGVGNDVLDAFVNAG